MAGKSYFRYKPASRMSGPYPLTRANCKRLPDVPGVYLLAAEDTVVKYVGRAEDLGARLAQHVGKTDMFYFRALDSEHEAFYAECREFHRYGKIHHLRNRIHPARPAGSGLKLCSEQGCNGEPE